jgi:hypothetical protein
MSAMFRWQHLHKLSRDCGRSYEDAIRGVVENFGIGDLDANPKARNAETINKAIN